MADAAAAPAPVGDIDASKTILFSACICCRNGIWTEFDKMAAGDICDAQCNFLCIQERACIQLNALDKPLLCGVPEGTICQVGLGCCAIALKQPELPTILKGKGHCLCCAQSAAFPFDAENPMMCAVCFLSLFPNVGVAMTWSDAMAAAK